MKRSLCLTVLVICLINSAFADLTSHISSIINNPSQKKVQFSVNIVNPQTGEKLYSCNANTAMIPASNMKIITSAASLHYLGSEWLYKTKIGLCDKTLVVIGSGDPLLGDDSIDKKYGRKSNWIFDKLVAKLKEMGVTSIDDIVVDSTVFDDIRVHPNWPKKQLNRWYACEISGVNYNDNCIDIITVNNAGKIKIIVEPKTDFVKITNKVSAINKGKSAVGSYRNPKPGENRITVFGKCRKKQGPFAVAIERPAVFFGFLLSEHLNRAGIKVYGKLAEKSVENFREFKQIAEFTTPLTDCLDRCNKDSLQLCAESLLKTISSDKNGGKNGNWLQSRKLVSKYLLTLGIKSEEFYIDDASGLSRNNRLSSNAITNVLMNIYNSKDWQLYKNSLAAGGVDGTIARYFKEEKYKGKIFGKTGYISGVKSFSGLCQTANGDVIFSILTNNTNSKTREAINDITKAIIDSK